MAPLEALTRGTVVDGIVPGQVVTILEATWIGDLAVELTYRDATGRVANALVDRDRESSLRIEQSDVPRGFDSEGDLLRMLSETQRMSKNSFRALVQAILEEYALHPGGCHGVVHWARVQENGLRLAATTGANVEVVKLFAVFHDSRRLNEGHDPQHGQRGADLARSLRGIAFELGNEEFGMLYEACAGHTGGITHPNVTVQTCWDSDRLDLGRVGIRPHPKRLCTDSARSDEMIRWAHRRATSGVVPELVSTTWGIQL